MRWLSIGCNAMFQVLVFQGEVSNPRACLAGATTLDGSIVPLIVLVEFSRILRKLITLYYIAIDGHLGLELKGVPRPEML